MKCTKCGYNSFDELTNCNRCGAEFVSKSDSGFTFIRDIGSEKEYDEPAHMPSLFEEQEVIEQTTDPLVLDSEVEENIDSYQVISKKTKNKYADKSASANYPGEYVLTLASIKRRAFSFFFDIVLIMLISFFTLVSGLYAAGINPVEGIDNISYILLPVYLTLTFLASTYFVVLHAYSGKTIGKMLFGIRVVNENGDRIGFADSFVRWIGYYISALPLLYGYISSAFDFNLQSWHDKLSKSFVIRG